MSAGKLVSTLLATTFIGTVEVIGADASARPPAADHLPQLNPQRPLPQPANPPLPVPATSPHKPLTVPVDRPAIDERAWIMGRAVTA